MRTAYVCRARTGSLALTICVSLLLACTAAAAARAPKPDARATLARGSRVQSVVDELRGRLGLAVTVVVDVVPVDPLLVSIARQPGRADAFRLSFEGDFLDSLGDNELRAVVAHELGHVWIFTHHPYLQTEELANRVALRVVGRDDLSRMYAKVWQRTGVEGHLAYLPPERAADHRPK